VGFAWAFEPVSYVGGSTAVSSDKSKEIMQTKMDTLVLQNHWVS
jgi:hypothetical protein